MHLNRKRKRRIKCEIFICHIIRHQDETLLNTNLKVIDVSVTTTANNYVSPFSAYGSVDISSYVNTYGEAIAIYLITSKSTVTCALGRVANGVNVWSNSAATLKIRLLCCKFYGTI